MDSVLEIILASFEKVGKSQTDAKTYQPLARLTKYLDFCLADDQRTLGTLKYLDAIRQKLPNLKKGKKDLMPFICESLVHIYQQTLTGVNMHDEEFQLLDNLEHWEQRKKQSKVFFQNNENSTRFWTLFQEIYDTLLKMAGKKEASVYLVNCMAMMVCRAKEDLYFQYLPDLIKFYTAGIKDKKERFDYFSSIKTFLTYLPGDYITKDLERFNSFIKVVTDQIFNKKVVLNEYRQDAENFLFEYAKKQIHVTWPKLMEEILKPENYKNHTNEQRAVALSCISRVARLFPDEIGKQNYLLGQLCTTIIGEEKMRSDVSLLRNVLKCFPRVRNTSEEKMKDVRAIIGTHCLLHSDKTVARNAAEALITSVEMEPGKTFLDVIEKFRDVMIKIDEIIPEVAYRLLKDLYLVLETFIHKVQESEKLILGLDIQVYNALRKKLEGMLLMYIIHTSAVVRNQALKVLKQLSKPELRAITKELTTSNSYLLDDLILVLQPDDMTSKTTTLLPCVEEMCKNHIDDAITKAWEELVKRWNVRINELDLSKIALLTNHLRFMCLAIRPSFSGKAEPFLGEIVQILTSKYHTTIMNHDKIKTAILDSLEGIHPTSMYMVLAQIRSIDIPRIFIKRENKIESSDPIYEQHVIDLLKRLITKTINNVSSITPSDFLFVKQGITVRDFFDELISNWTSKDRIDVKDIAGSFLSIHTWKDAAEIIATYLKHLNTISRQTALEKGTDIGEQSVWFSNTFKKNTLHNSLTSIFKFLHPETNTLARFNQEAANALQQVCSFGMIEDEKFINDILRYFEKVIINTREVDIVPAMSEFLTNNPQTIRTFIINTYYESFNRLVKEESTETETTDDTNKVKKSPSLFGNAKKDAEEPMEKEQELFERKKFKANIPHICKNYLAAIVKVMEDHLDHWIQEQHITLGSMFYLSLIHCCTRGNIALRDKAHELVNLIIKSELSNGNINYGTAYHCISVGDECVYKKTVDTFSEYVARTAPEITYDLISEAERTVDLLDGVNRENTLRLITPWAYNFGDYVKTCLDTASTNDNSYKMKDFISQRLLKLVYSITEKLHGPEDSQIDDSLKSSNLFKIYIEKIWFNLIRSSDVCKWVVPETVKFIIENYDFAFSQYSVAQPLNPVHTLLRAIFVYICRDPKSLPAILENTVIYLRDYKDKLPESKKDMVKYIIERGVSEPADAETTYVEVSALQLLVDVTYEHDIALVPHLPKIFMNCVVLFNSCQNTKQFGEAKLILENILQSLAIRHRDAYTATTVYIDKTIHFLHDSIRKNTSKLSRSRNFIQQWTEYISKKHRPELAEAISEISLNWALQAKDNKISLESYHVFEALNKNFSYEVIEKLVTGFFDAVRVRDDAKISIIMDIFFNIPADKLSPPRVSKLLFQVTFWLFFSWNKTHFSRGLKYILKLQALTQFDNIDEAVLNASMFNVWKGYTGEESVDVSISRVIFKGLTDVSTFSDTFELYNNLIVKFDTYLPKGDNMLVATTLIIQAILYLSGDFSKKQLLGKLCEKHTILQEFETAFSTFEQAFTKVQSTLITNEENVSEIIEHNKAYNEFVVSFSKAYQKVFGNKNGGYVMWLLVMLPKNANIKWSMGSILLLSKLLPVVFQAGVWTVEELVQLSLVIRECVPENKTYSYFRNQIFHNAAKDILEFVGFHAHDKQEKFTNKEAKEIFPFLYPVRGFLTSVRARNTNDTEAFVGSNRTEREIARSEIICRMWYQTFGLQIDSSVNSEESNLLGTIIDYKSQSVADAPSSPSVTNYFKTINQKPKKLTATPEIGIPGVTDVVPPPQPQVEQHQDINVDEDDDEPELAIPPPPPESDSDDEESENVEPVQD